MVLDKMEKGEDGQLEFVFKTTYAKDKQVIMKVDAEEAPDEFFFVNIEYISNSAGISSTELENTQDLPGAEIGPDSEASTFKKRRVSKTDSQSN